MLWGLSYLPIAFVSETYSFENIGLNYRAADTIPVNRG